VVVHPPNMMLFDTPTRDFCMVQRENTSTPLQALVLMNDPQFLETSKALAMRAYHESDGDKEATIQYMFKLATSREAKENELVTLSDMYEDELQIFKDNPKKAEALLKYGQSENTTDAKLAAFSFVANTIFNLDETIRKS